jgi:hypothetical protein
VPLVRVDDVLGKTIGAEDGRADIARPFGNLFSIKEKPHFKLDEVHQADS